MITIKTVEDIEILRESEDVECKKAIGKEGKGELPDSFWETYSAMANTDGGHVFLGLFEKNGRYSLSGLISTESLRKNLVDLANNSNKVSHNLLTNSSFEEIQIAGKLILHVTIPRASRRQRPVFLKGNPLGNSYRRLYEADQRMSDEEVKRFLGEQLDDSRDTEILFGYTIKDIYSETLQNYRRLYATLNPAASAWNALDDWSFLEVVGGARYDRQTGATGLTVAGLLMFGKHPAIQERFPYFMLDYQERAEAKTSSRWIDRLTLDGSWSGNLYDFYHRVYSKLVVGLKTPFLLEKDRRVDETPVHVALREALVNTLVHADYSDRASILIVKRPDMFGFRNPGLMRIPLAIALKGGEADCRNRNLHKMFRFVGIGEQAGSGIPKILDGWKRSHWRPPSLQEKTEPYDQTILELRMLDLFPTGTVNFLRCLFGKKYDQLGYSSQVALALAFSEGMVTHDRLKQLTDEHPTDLSRTIHHLVVDLGMLNKSGNGRGASYHLTGLSRPLDPDDVFDPEPNTAHLDSNTTHLGLNTTHLGLNTTHLGSNTTHLGSNTTHLKGKSAKRDPNGCIIHKRLGYPVVDKIDKINKELREKLEQIAAEARASGKLSVKKLEKTLQALCDGRYITISALASLLGRTEKTLRNSYLSRMVKENKLSLAFPKSPRDTRQAYIATASLHKEK